MTIAIRLDSIRKVLRGHVALERVDFAVESGSLTGLIGMNGAGKTTTLRVLLGLLRPDKGSCEILGVNSRDVAVLCGRVGAQLHGGGLDPSLTVDETLRYAAMLAGVRDSDREGVLERVDLVDFADRRAGKLSAGERQRLAVARALLLKPDVLILDEPLTHLDPGSAESISRVLRGEADRGAAVLLSSHQLDFLDRVADRVVFLHRGRVLAAGSPSELLGGTGVAYRLGAAPADRAQALLSSHPLVASVERDARDVRDARPGDGSTTAFRVRIESGAAGGAAEVNEHLVRGGCRVDCLAPERRSLHDVFLERVRDADRARSERPATHREAAEAAR